MAILLQGDAGFLHNLSKIHLLSDARSSNQFYQFMVLIFFLILSLEPAVRWRFIQSAMTRFTLCQLPSLVAVNFKDYSKLLQTLLIFQCNVSHRQISRPCLLCNITFLLKFCYFSGTCDLSF